MKLIDYTYICTKPKRQAILATVFLALMFIIPVAQALHISEHDIFSNDYDCLVCHSVAAQDDITTNSIHCSNINYQPITLINSQYSDSASFSHFFHDTIRAPPIAHH